MFRWELPTLTRFNRLPSWEIYIYTINRMEVSHPVDWIFRGFSGGWESSVPKKGPTICRHLREILAPNVGRNDCIIIISNFLLEFLPTIFAPKFLHIGKVGKMRRDMGHVAPCGPPEVTAGGSEGIPPLCWRWHRIMGSEPLRHWTFCEMFWSQNQQMMSKILNFY